MKKIIISCFLVYLGLPAISQNVELKAPPLAGKEAKLYYFEGAKVDSLTSTIDAQGKAQFSIPDKDYQGMTALVVGDAGGVEMIVAEPTVAVECSAMQLNNQTLSFPRSEENRFIKHIFTSQSRYMQRQAWLKGGEQFYQPFSSFRLLLNKELQEVEKGMVVLDKEISSSELYAAKYFRLAGFMNRLFDTEQKRDVQGAMLIRKEMEEILDIASLYRSGQVWGSALNFYASLFNHTAGDNKQEQYATSVLKTLERLSAPYYEAFLAGCITETERFGWLEAQNSILSNILGRAPSFTSDIHNLQRAIGAYRVNNSGQMPLIVGLKESDKSYETLLIAFHDSDCGSCVKEISHLRTIYPVLQAKGIRVVSIASDTDKGRYEEATKDFPWEDKLCDFKGFMGENFSNYNVIGSPSFYLINKDGKLGGIYFSIADIEIK